MLVTPRNKQPGFAKSPRAASVRSQTLNSTELSALIDERARNSTRELVKAAQDSALVCWLRPEILP